MTAADELRRMLDERSIRWEDGPWSETTIFYAGDAKWRSSILLEDKVHLAATFDSPEQAIAATLGTGTCHKVLDFDGTAWICSECGEHIGPRRWNYCPNCGRRIEVGE